ncbi:MAG: uracil phosphoribosyltransferase [Flavobacteriales bacterium]|nr:uracil phosphoribosyltransferase [Flavobacteriales bacterium]
MDVHVLCEKNSLFSQFIAEIRDIEIQQDPLRFRRNLERMGEIFAYEISQRLDYVEKKVTTPLGVADAMVPKVQPTLATILRAGLPLHQGLLNFFDRGNNAFISAYRKHDENGNFDIHVEYLASPSIEGCTLVLSDPMLATGQSMILCYEAILQKGVPSHTHIVAVLASEEGLEYARKKLPDNTTIWVGDVDKVLTPNAYIAPGLGDAGDLAFGTKT